jgi:formylglycine-generating enzyme
LKFTLTVLLIIDLGNNVFEGNDDLLTINVPEDLYAAYIQAPRWSDFSSRIQSHFTNTIRTVNAPVLFSGMNPVYWDNEMNEVVKYLDPILQTINPNWDESKWYAYTNTAYDPNVSKWANVKALDGSYFVWIPRYIYKISSGWHTNTHNGVIDIIFIIGTDDYSAGVTLVNTGQATDSNGTWTSHPAFTFGDLELPGLWVAKFESSNNQGKVASIPNVQSWRSITSTEMFNFSRAMENDIIHYGWKPYELDSHQMKNTEWGVVAYLAHSKYGLNGVEIGQNNNSTYHTGGGINQAYLTNTHQSTTGNVYGIYDMSGGAYEITAAYLNYENHQFLVDYPCYLQGEPYCNVYGTTYASTINQKGDAVYETGTSQAWGSNGWFNDWTYYPGTNNVFFSRGSKSTLGAPQPGLFAFDGARNYASSHDFVASTFRVVLTPKTYDPSDVYIIFDTQGGEMIYPLALKTGYIIDIPENPYKEGHTFVGWFLDLFGDTPFETGQFMPNEDIVLYARWEMNHYHITYLEEDRETIIYSVTYDYNEDLSFHEPPEPPFKEGHRFVGWAKTPTSMPANHLIYYAMYVPADFDEMLEMVQVGSVGSNYLIPTGTNNSGSANVKGGYLMAATETTYELWYNVRIWAEANGYYFQNLGVEGHNQIAGAEPTNRMFEPVTHVSWRDVIVWLNAFSEMSNLNPVYRTNQGIIIKDSRDSNGAVVDQAIQTHENGYRLPTSDEWEMAARWTNDDFSINGSVLRESRYWTTGNFASGATQAFNQAAATGLVSWYNSNSNSQTQPVASKTPNQLGIYDMSGNVWEWTYTKSGVGRIVRGGGFNYASTYLQVGDLSGNGLPNSLANSTGFRIVRTTSSEVDYFEVKFVDMEDKVLSVEYVIQYKSANPKSNLLKEGHTFIGWDQDYSCITENMVIKTIFEINVYQIIFYEEDGETILHMSYHDFGEDIWMIDLPEAPYKEGYQFVGWALIPDTMPGYHLVRVASYIPTDFVDSFPMVQVGEVGVTYEFRAGTNDNVIKYIDGGFHLAIYQTTYELWYTVRIWAEANGYYFANRGREGSTGTIGQAPTEKKLEPVTTISSRDMIVWLNAYSEMIGLNPVYTTSSYKVIKDARNTNGEVVDLAVQTQNNGYRLPTFDEWEMAARWKNDTESIDGSILVGGRYWTPGRYTSGSTGLASNLEATDLVAWYGQNSNGKTQPVGLKLPNHLGIFDMCGNVWEVTFRINSKYYIKGGNYSTSHTMYLQIGASDNSITSTSNTTLTGFRIARNHIEKS